MTPDHTISYSYPESIHSALAGFNETGCYTLRTTNGHFEGFATLEDAKRKALQLGTLPGRWSLDYIDKAGRHEP